MERCLVSDHAAGSPPTFVELPSGTLMITVKQADMPLRTLCGFASRHNPARGYLFVSKVLGKHIPVRPVEMLAVYKRLAAKVALHDGPTVVLGMAETATALSQGIYERLLAVGRRPDILYQHTTRYALQRPLAFEFAEAHSHAPQHLLYQPETEPHQRLLASAEHLILIDDEISTGVTLANLVQAYGSINPRLRTLQVVSLTNWLSAGNEQLLRQSTDAPIQFHQLLRGEFRFDPCPRYRPPGLESAAGKARCVDDFLPQNFGRLGYCGRMRFPFAKARIDDGMHPGDRVLVLGTGEFAYPPLLLARWLERQGMSVHFQTTTRSPIVPGADIASVAATTDHVHEGVRNFVYNITAGAYDRIVICYETPSLPLSHDLPRRLNAMSVFFDPAGLRIC